MQKYFIDTSALVKFFVIEPGTDKVEQIVLGNDNLIFITHLSILEFYSALFKKYRTGELIEDQLTNALKGFDESLYLFEILQVDSKVIDHAKILMKNIGKEYAIRTLDAIQLSSYTLLDDKNIIMINADKIFCSIVESLNYKVINPVA